MCLGGRQAAAPVKRVGGYDKDHYNGNIFDPKPASEIAKDITIKKKEVKKKETDNTSAKLNSGLAKNNYASSMNQSGLTIT